MGMDKFTTLKIIDDVTIFLQHNDVSRGLEESIRDVYRAIEKQPQWVVFEFNELAGDQ